MKFVPLEAVILGCSRRAIFRSSPQNRRENADIQSIVPEGFDRTEESNKREILKLRIENERLKKSYAVQMNSDGQPEYVRLKEKSSK